MHKFDKAVEYAKELLEATRSRPDRLLDSASSTSKWKTVYQKLLDLYLEENKKEPKCMKLKCTSHLLAKLVVKDHLNTLVVNLYPGTEGYSLMLKGRSGADSETIRLPYEQSELLDYIDAEQLPPMLVDLLDRVQANIFYCGCVIAEIHDYRRSVNNLYDTQFVLLRPTPQTLMVDMNTLTAGSHRWSQEDRLALEGQLLVHTSEPLCLDPDPAAAIVANNLSYHKHKLNTHSIRRSIKKYSQAAVNRKRKLAQSAAPKHLKLHDFISRKKDKVKASPPVNLKVGKTCVDMWRQRDVQLTTPDTIEVEKYAKAFEKPKMNTDNTPMVVEEYTFETERSHGKVYYSRLTILQRLNEEFYHGQLYVDRDYVEGVSTGSTCKFPLGTKANVEKYIRQFREIFTEEGRRQVKISHQVPGQRPTVSYTQNLHALATTPQPQGTAGGAAQGGTGGSQQGNLTATITGQLGLTSPGIDSSGKKAAPIRLSLSLQPQAAANVTNAQGTPVTAQLTLNLPQQQLAAAHRLRQMNIYQGLQRSTSGGQGSSSTNPPTLTPVTGTVLHMTSSVKTSSSLKTPTPTATPTPTPTGTPTPTPPPQGGGGPGGAASGLRRLSGVEGMVSHPLHLNITGNIVQALSSRQQTSSSAPQTPSSPTAGDLLSVAPLAPLSSDTLSTSSSSSSSSGPHSGLLSVPSGATPPPNVNIANIGAGTGPPNINIQNITGLQGVNLAANLQGLQNLQNVQVSLSGVTTLPGGGLALPAGILVGSLPPGVTPIAGGSSGTITATANTQQHGGTTGPGSTSLVTMVTAASTTPTSVVLTSGVSMGSSGGHATTQGSGSGMLSVPINVAGNITQFMTATGIKGASGIRPGTPLLLSQIPGQAGQQVQLLSGTLTTKAGASTSATSTATVLTPHSLVTQPTSLTVPGLRTSAGQQPQVLTAQQVVQLTSQPQITRLALQQHHQKASTAGGTTSSGQPQKQLSALQQQKIQQLILQQKITPQQLQQLQRQQQLGTAVLTPVGTAGVSGGKPKSKKKSSSSSSPKQ